MKNKIQGKKFQFPGDIIAALTGSISSIPDGMSAAVMAGVNPMHGLYASAIAPVAGSWTTSSVFMSVSTTSALALAAGSGLSGIREEDKIAAIVLLTIVAGLIQLLLGLFKLGFLVQFVSNSVMRGFLTGVAVMIILGQSSDFFGSYQSEYQNKVLRTIDILIHPAQWNFYNIGTALAMLALILLFKKTPVRKLAMFAALLIVAVLINLLFPDALKLVGTENQITNSLPKLQLPEFALFKDVFLSAFAVAIIGFIQGAGVSHMKPNPDGSYPQVSGDLRGQGIANIFSGSITGIPVGGSMGQTSLLYSSGARSRWANFLCGITVGLIILSLGNLIELIPLACFAAILILAGIDSINEEEITTIWETSMHSRLIMIFTFIATLSLTVPQAVLLSIVLTFILHVVKSSNRVTLKRIRIEEGNFIEGSDVPKKLGKNSIVGLQPYGSLFFAGAYAMKEILPDPSDSGRSVVIIILRGKKEVGSTFIQVVHRYARELKDRNGKLMLVGVSDNVYSQLERTGVVHFIGAENVFKVTKIVGKPFKDAWTNAEKWVH